MKSVRKTVPFLIVAILLLCSCASPVSATQSPPPLAVSPSAAPPPTPDDSLTTTTAEPSPSPSAGEEISISPDRDGYAMLPGSLPPLTDADKNKFNPGKVLSYLAEDGLLTYKDYWYTLKKADLKGGVLYLTLALNVSPSDVNDVYKDLKAKPSLSGKQILAIPALKGCEIHDGVMYAESAAWEDRKGYDSYKDWLDDNNGLVNFLEPPQVVKLASPVPVADSAQIVLYDYNGSSKYTNITMQEFTDYLTAPENAGTGDDSGFIIDFMYFKFSDGKITAVYGDSGDYE